MCNPGGALRAPGECACRLAFRRGATFSGNGAVRCGGDRLWRGAATENNFRIGDIRFLGRDWLVLLRNENFPALEPLRARVTSLDGLSVGAAAAIRFDPCGTFIFAA